MPRWISTFHVAGLEVLVCSRAPAKIPGFARYDDLPSSGRAADLVVELDAIPGFARGRRPGAEHPAFGQKAIGMLSLRLTRWDAEGEVTFPRKVDDPMRARFVVSEAANAFEAALRVSASVALPRRGAFLLHASAVAGRRGGLVFCGPSGAGKSTIAALLSDREHHLLKLADELLILRQDHGQWRAYVSPFAGRESLPQGTSRPVAGIHFLAKASRHEKTPLGTSEALRLLLRNILVYAAQPDTTAQVLALAAGIVSRVPCYRLEFAPCATVAEILDIH